MTDRELLELAAKAEGHAVEFDEVSGLSFFDTRYTGILWDPLHSDGDALRLAAALRINIYFGHEGEGPIHCGPFGKDGATEWDAGTEQESLRRAIVRAAAEIGKALP
jgi:hypothetical protein